MQNPGAKEEDYFVVTPFLYIGVCGGLRGCFFRPPPYTYNNLNLNKR